MHIFLLRKLLRISLCCRLFIPSSVVYLYLKALCDVHFAGTPDADEGKLPDSAAADEWDITSPPVEQRPADASATVTSPEKKKKPRIRGLGTQQQLSYCTVTNANMHTFVLTCSSMCACLI